MAPADHFGDIGPRIKALIEAKCGARQVAAVARRGKMSAAHLDQVLTGRRMPRLETLNRILLAIPATPAELFGDR